MTILQELILFSFISGLTIFLGGIAASIFERVKNQDMKKRVVHAVMALGGGILISAIGFVLVPPAMETFGIGILGVIFIGGAVSFQIILYVLEKQGGSVAQLLAMMMDFIPESVSLGAVFVHDHAMGILLAIFIGLQNLPESFNTYGDLRKTMSKKKVLMFLFALSFTGVAAALFGMVFLSNSPKIIAAVMAFAGGGIMFLIFQDIAPSSKVEKSARPAVWATVGFFIGMIAQKVAG